MANAFWDDLTSDMQDNPARAQRLTLEVARIEAIDHALNKLDEARDAQHLTKAELAEKIGVNPAGVRRLFTGENQNPQFGTVAVMAAALGYRLDLVPMSDGGGEPIPRDGFAMPLSRETPRVA